MFTLDQYELLDFGNGRRLERFGAIVLDRPCPAVEQIEQSDPDMWQQADARFDSNGGEEGRWTAARDLSEQWVVTHGSIHFELKCTPFGQVGLFPEQAGNWNWLAGQIQSVRRQEPLRVLNLFAYTGGSTLAASAAGAQVVHVDAAKNIVGWARRNAELSGIADRPIQWIIEDAQKFVKRELRRGNRYDAVILDPPSYGHGPRGEVWRLAKHLPGLLSLCGELTAGRRCFMLLTCHTPGFSVDRMRAMMQTALGDAESGDITVEELTILAADGRQLPCGAAVRWLRSSPLPPGDG
jgi:23S rRNA (cytosine1962-C5)-methyltransferase